MADEAPNLQTQEELAELLEGRTDEEIVQFIDAIGVDQVLAQIFSAMEERFEPEKAAGESAVVQWDVDDAAGTHSYTVTIADGTCTATSGPADSPRLTLTLALPDFMRFIAGKLDGMQAFIGGKLRLTGDLLFAQQMQGWFGR